VDLGTTAYTVADCLAAQPDLAYVLGVHAAMPDICRGLIAARIPFVLEKPGAAAVTDLAAVRDEAEAAGVPATVALVQRYGPLPELLGRIGDLRHVRFSFVAGPPSRYIDAGCGWVLDRSVSGGGCLYLLGVHFTDMLRHVTGQPITAARSVRRYPDGADTDDYGVLILETAGGTAATVGIGWTFPIAPVKRYVNYTAVGAGGHVAVDTAGGVELNTPGQNAVHETVDVDSDASTRSSSPPSPQSTTTVSPVCRPAPTSSRPCAPSNSLTPKHQRRSWPARPAGGPSRCGPSPGDRSR
jgi:predicted dehydrogenase